MEGISHHDAEILRQQEEARRAVARAEAAAAKAVKDKAIAYKHSPDHPERGGSFS